ncbi:MAG: DnaD domain protein [Clostridia bacterium]|nr:DnaD domain protein [Clostridia bacterium]
MHFSLSKELDSVGFTEISNSFITEYLPDVDGDAVKIYLYGLFMCKNPKYDLSLSEMSNALKIPEDKIVDWYRVWSSFDLGTFTEEPFSVTYLPVRREPKKFDVEKYTDFCALLQQKFPNRSVSVNEYSEYFSLMEVYSITQDAMLLIVDYCIKKKGEDIRFAYISKVAKDFGIRGICTAGKVEAEISKYVAHTAEIEKILSAMNSTKQPEVENLNQLNKWTKDLGYNFESILCAAKTLKKGSFDKLDALMDELFSLKCFSVEEITRYADKKKELFNCSLKIAKELSLYFEVIEPVVNDYTSKWYEKGYNEDSLLYIAKYCFKHGKNSFENMDKMINALYQKGLISVNSLTEFFLEREENEEFLQKMLDILGLTRQVTAWDQNNLEQWRSWNFTDEMIEEAFKRAVGKTSPIPYVNAILGRWKSQNVFTKEEVEKEDRPVKTKQTAKVTVEMITAKYEELRFKANETANKNLAVMEKVAGFKKAYEDLKNVEIELAMSSFKTGKTSEDELEEKKKLLSEKVDSLLKEKGLVREDLSPRFKCRKCNDTGFDGLDKCSCYKEIFDECQRDLSIPDNK